MYNIQQHIVTCQLLPLQMSSVVYLINKNVRLLALINRNKFDTKSNRIFFFSSESPVTTVNTTSQLDIYNTSNTQPVVLQTMVRDLSERHVLEWHDAIGQFTGRYPDAVNVRLGVVATQVLHYIQHTSTHTQHSKSWTKISHRPEALRGAHPTGTLRTWGQSPKASIQPKVGQRTPSTY